MRKFVTFWKANLDIFGKNKVTSEKGKNDQMTKFFKKKERRDKTIPKHPQKLNITLI